MPVSSHVSEFFCQRTFMGCTNVPRQGSMTNPSDPTSIIQSERIAACVLNDQGVMLPYTARSTKEQVEEWAAEYYGPAWNRLKELGCRVVQIRMILDE